MASNCPQCAAPLPFRPGTMVSVCKGCGSLCARTDRDPELIGRVAALVDTGSPLAVGATGRHAGRAFAITGRVQMAHPLGGVWNEWYLALDDGRWGWLAEAQGRFLLTFEREPKAALPAFEALEAGRSLDLGPEGHWTVQEKSRARMAGAEGEIPWRVEPGVEYAFADLSGREGAFATLDYGDEPPTFYLGREIPFAELNLKGVDAPPPTRGLKALALNCPNCAGPLKLHAPDQTERVACPNCGGLLDASQGKLRFLKALKQPHPMMYLPLGAEGRIRGVPYVVIGHMVRSCAVDGVTYDWREYLLMDPRHGFRWMVESDGHWSFVEPLPAGEVPSPVEGTRSFSWKGQNWRRFQDVLAKVEGVWGEFYWKVEQGEQAAIAEFVAPPQSLAWEGQTHAGGGQEISVSLSTYMEPQEVAQAFQLKETLPTPRGVASFQPNLRKPALSVMLKWMAVGLAALVMLVLFQSVTHRSQVIWNGDLELSPSPEQVWFSPDLRIDDGHKNLAFTLASSVDNQWVGVEGALVNKDTGEVEMFEVSSSYYHGVDEGEAWSEGSASHTVYLSSLPAGTYTLRLAPAWDGPRPPVRMLRMELKSGVMRWAYLGLAFLALVLGPIIQGFRVLAFEGRRWQESMYHVSSDGDSGSDD